MIALRGLGARLTLVSLFLSIVQYDSIFTGINLEAGALICLIKAVRFNIIEIQNVTVVILTLFVTLLILMAIFLLIVLILYCIKKKSVKRRPKVAPALIAALMGKVIK